MSAWREFDAAGWVLSAPLIASRTVPFVSSQHETGFPLDWDGLVEASGSWSSGERLMVRAALDLWNGAEPVGLRELVGVLDPPNLQRVLEGVLILAGSPPSTAAAAVDELQKRADEIAAADAAADGNEGHS